MAAREVIQRLALLALFLCGPAFAAAPRANFDIPAGVATKTLQSFYEQTHIEILYLADTPRGLLTNPVSGDLDVETALSEMLRGLPISFTFDPSYRFVSVRPAQQVTGNATPDTAVAEAVVRGLPEQGTGEGGMAPGVIEPPPTVFVTGTYIPGALDIPSPLVSVQRRQVLSSSYSTVQDVLQEMPIASKAGPSEDAAGTGNFNRGAGINLRGLGMEATLVLINGRRQPSSGVTGSFVDVSNIPASAIDRIEVLPDGASAIYGSDAIAGVVNVILRTDVDGIETFLRRGEAEGSADETLLSQTLGTRWRTGHGTLSYQYMKRSALPAFDRRYARNSDKTPLGGSDFRSNLSSPANIFDTRTLQPLFGVTQRTDGAPLTPDALSTTINLQDKWATFDLLPNRTQHNVLINGRQELGRWDLNSEIRLGRRYMTADYYAVDQLLAVSAKNPYVAGLSPTSPVIAVGYSFLDDFGVIHGEGRTDTFETSLGLSRNFSSDWTVSLNGWLSVEDMQYTANNQPDLTALTAALNSTELDSAFNPFGRNTDTVLKAIRSVQEEAALSKVNVSQFLAGGPVFSMPGGKVKVSLGLERRSDVFRRGTTDRQEFGRQVESLFTEAAVPLIGDPNNSRETPRLELSAAVRHEKYSDFGSTTNPKFGLRWAPDHWLKLRGSWGTSYRAPKLVDIYDDSHDTASLALLPDPQSPTGRSLVVVRQGRGQNLREETASTWTAGVDLAFHEILDANFSATYFSTRYRDRLVVPAAGSMFDILRQEDRWTSAVTRSPTQEAVDAVCDMPGFNGSVAQCKSSQVVALVDYRVRNLAATRAQGLDLRVDYDVSGSLGHFHSELQSVYYLELSQAASPESAYMSILDTVGNPSRFRTHGMFQWSERSPMQPGLGLSLGFDYTGSYRDLEAGRKVKHLTILDARASYRTPEHFGALSSMEIGLNLANVLNTSPPFVDRVLGYDQMNSDPYGRVWSLTAEKRW